jgi:dTDP-4-amino-4,6-dideoxygalactose transaminase
VHSGGLKAALYAPRSFRYHGAMIPHSSPLFDVEDEAAVCATLARKFVTHGDTARKLGAAGAAVMGKRWGIAVQSGTDAITAALRILGVGPGARVALPAYMCGAALDACALLGATPVFIDVAEATLAIDPAKVNAERGLAAVVAAHLFGMPAPVREIDAAPVIEDCAQTLGIPVGGRPVGAHGAFGIASFYGTKLLAAGHGGILVGDDPAYEKKAWGFLLHDKIESWEPHFHFLMSDLTASLALSQLGKLARFIAARRALAARFADALGACSRADCAYARFIVVAEDADGMIARFRGAGIDAKLPVHMPAALGVGIPEERIPVTVWARRHCVSVPLYPGLSEEHEARIVGFLKEHAHALRCWPSA